jgi:hypothetical protein
MPRIRALTTWSGHNAGEEWDASDEEARILCTPDLPGGQKAQYVDRAMQAVAQEQTPTQPDTPEKRRYMRRDLRAQT